MIWKKACDENKARAFVSDVRRLARLYGLDFFVVTEGASATSSRGCAAVEHARSCHEQWERENGIDPAHDWSKE